MKLIINADDLGLSGEVNDKIFELMAGGKVTSATLLANGKAFRDASWRHADFSRCSFGVHLNLTYGSPLTDLAVWKRYNLLNDDGQFNASFRSVRPSLELLKAIINEWCVQIEVVKAAGVAISHLDSHHHVHTIPWLFPALKVVQKKYAINKVRISLNLYPRRDQISLKLHLGKYLWNLALRQVYPTRVTECFTHFPWFLEQLARKKTFGDEVVEVMVHPGAPECKDETTLLQTEWESAIPGLCLASYDDL
jgi:chitin disaccharide deacetylase